MIDPNREVLAMPTPAPEVDIQIRLCAQVDYSLDHLRLVVAFDDAGMRALKSTRNQLSSLRCRCNGFVDVPEQVAPIRTMAMEVLGHLAALDSLERVAGKSYLPSIVKALELLVQTITPQPKPAKAAKAA